WLLAYRDAMSFRASHYFVSFVSEATATAAGFGYSKEDQSWSELAVARCNSIELPRSLVEVVVSWNIPMHKWLKT
ncbi:Proteincysteine Npalmitoyltransferase porcupinelike, partial [Caligus rogercresseyi]